jgi:beta-ribofuranosylaminobenzene 5'-phosphate synthase
MLASIVEIVAPSRLHFGMFSFGLPGTRQFGGVGAMVEQPGLRLRITSSDHFEAHGPLNRRVVAIAERVARALKLADPPGCRIEVIAAPPEHVGLGTGTQLALSVAAGLNALRGGPPLEPEALAALSGRAERSAIGTYGFIQGGLIVEPGKLPDERFSPLQARVELPSKWRFVLICPHGSRGLSGEAEQRAFRELPPVPRATTDRLLDEVSRALLPAARAGDFESFSESLYRFGYEAGQCFAARQAGAFASPRLAQWVRAIRQLGVRGVGQSSWGPTLFALVPSTAAAGDLIERFGEQLDSQDAILVAEPNNSGAQITRHVQP